MSLKAKAHKVINLTDKSSTVLVMKKSDYITEVERQQADDIFYLQLESDATNKFSDKIIKHLTIMLEKAQVLWNI